MRIGIVGVLGRTGSAVVDLARDARDIEIVAPVGRPGSEGRSIGAGTTTSRETALSNCDVIIDFSTAEASAELAREAARRGGPALVIGSTGFSQAQATAIEGAAASIAIVKSGNFSLGVNLLAALVSEAARRLEPEAWDIEIAEAHHRHKRDAPSGTALMLGEAAARGRGRDLASVRAPPHDGAIGERPPGTIGFSVMRGGEIVGEHSVVFAGEDEILTLAHSARDRRLFARGALAAARWVVGRPPGLYGMAEVLSLGSGASDDAG